MQKMISLFIVCLFILVCSFVNCQDKEYASYIIKELSSPNFYGRSYYKKGLKKSEKFIINELKRINSQNIKTQTLKYYVYVAKKTTLVLDGKVLNDGYDYILFPTSKKNKGIFKTILVTKNNFDTLKKLTSKEPVFVLVDSTIQNDKFYKEELIKIIENNKKEFGGYLFLKNKPISYKGYSGPQKRGIFKDIKKHVKIYNKTVGEVSYEFSEVKNLEIEFKPKRKKIRSKNIYTFKEGITDTIILFCGHYDHLGTFGKAYYPGANDNAAAIAMLLDIYKEIQNFKPYYTVYLVFFTGEEHGLLGSFYFVDNLPLDSSKLYLVINLDVIGSGEEGVYVVNGKVFSEIFEKIEKISQENSIDIQLKARGKANNSDHAPFFLKGYKALFFYSSGKTGPYHHPDDKFEELSLAKYNEIVKLMLLLTKKSLFY